MRPVLFLPVVNMFAAGEESGRIGAGALRATDAQDVEVNWAVKARTVLSAPSIVALCVLAGFLGIAMLLSMPTLSSTMGERDIRLLFAD